MTIILGIDPGSRYTGFGLIQDQGRDFKYLASGQIVAGKNDHSERLQKIFVEIKSVVQQYAPHEIAVEKVFVHANPGGALKLGQARGVAIVAATENQLPFAEYSARQIKQAVVGFGAATKQQVQMMVKRLLNLQQELGADEADALAVALCHAHARVAKNKLGLYGKMNFRRGRKR